MPLQLNGREAFLSHYFNSNTFGSTYRFFQYMGLATGNPGDLGGIPANESTVTTRLLRDTSSIRYEQITSNGFCEVVYNQQLIFAAATGSALITHWFTSESNVVGNPSTKFYEQFPVPINVQSGDQVRWLPYKWSIRFSDVITANPSALNHLEYISYSNGGSTSTPWSNFWWMGLSSTTPTLVESAPLDYNFTEPTTGSYARTVNGSWTVTNDGTDAYITNPSAITFPTATGPWSGLTHWGMFASSTGGELLAFGALDSTVNVLTGETPSFLANDWYIRMPPL